MVSITRVSTSLLLLPLLLSSAPASAAKTKAELAEAARAILEANCSTCHGQGGDAGLNVADLENMKKKGIVIPGDPKNSLLLKRIDSKESPMPPAGSTDFSPDNRAILAQWIQAGAPAWKARPATQAPPPKLGTAPGGLIDAQQVHALVSADLQKLPEAQRQNYRYFSLAHLQNYKAAPIPLDTVRAALIKLTNYTSINPKIVQPTKVDDAGLLYRVNIRELGWSDQAWTEVTKGNPYRGAAPSPKPGAPAPLPRSPEQIAIDQTVRADWFIATASKGPAYSKLLQINKVYSPAQYGETPMRSGFAQSGTEANNRIIARYTHATDPKRWAWRSFNQDANTGNGNIFAKPLGPAKGPLAFEHADSDIIVKLPNGLHAYLTVDPNNQAKDELNALTPGKCATCHVDGLIKREDQIRSSTEERKGVFAPQDYDEILRLYRPKFEFDNQVNADNADFQNATKEMKLPLGGLPGGKQTASVQGEPINAVAQWYKSQVTLDGTAAEVGVSPEALLNGLKKDPQIILNLGSLLSQKTTCDANGNILSRVPAGVVRRDALEAMFQDVTRLATTDLNAPKLAVPYATTVKYGDQVNLLKAAANTDAERIKAMEDALPRITTVEDFFKILAPSIPNPSAQYLGEIDLFVRKHADRLVELGATPNNLFDLKQSSFVSDETRLALTQAGFRTARNAADYFLLMHPGNRPSEKHVADLANLAETSTATFLALKPTSADFHNYKYMLKDNDKRLKAMGQGLNVIQSASDFLRYTEHDAQYNHSEAYRAQLERFAAEHANRAADVAQTPDEMIYIRNRFTTVEAKATLAKEGLRLVTTPDQFLSMVDFSGIFPKETGKLAAEVKAGFYGLYPSDDQKQAYSRLIQLNPPDQQTPGDRQYQGK